MSQENVEVIKRAVAALNERDRDGYLACCTEDVQLLPPTAELEEPTRAPKAFSRFLADIRDAMPDFRLEIERLKPIGPDRLLVFLRATVSGRTTGIVADLQLTNIYELAGGKIRRVQVFADRDRALEAAGLRE